MYYGGKTKAKNKHFKNYKIVKNGFWDISFPDALFNFFLCSLFTTYRKI